MVTCLQCMFNCAEDIDVQDNTDSAADTAADDYTDADVSNGQRSAAAAAAAVELKSSPMQQKSGGKGPLKSIIKKREERAREKIQRKESDIATVVGLAAPKRGSHFKEFLELHVSKSPRHSVSMSSVVGAASSTESQHTAAAAAVDASTVHLTAVRQGSASHSSTDTDSTAAGRASLHHLSADVPDDSMAATDSASQLSHETNVADSTLHEQELPSRAAEDIDDTQL